MWEKVVNAIVYNTNNNRNESDIAFISHVSNYNKLSNRFYLSCTYYNTAVPLRVVYSHKYGRREHLLSN